MKIVFGKSLNKEMCENSDVLLWVKAIKYKSHLETWATWKEILNRYIITNMRAQQGIVASLTSYVPIIKNNFMKFNPSKNNEN